DPDALELAVVTAASIVEWALANGFRVALTTNGLHRLRTGPVAIGATNDPIRRRAFLSALGRLQPLSAHPFALTLAVGSQRLVYGTTVVAIGAIFGPADLARLIGLRRRGHPVSMLVTGRSTLPAIFNGIDIRRIGPPESWRSLARIDPLEVRQ
ncbi:MAG TPA: hypothetical protein VKT80_06160, partial [Chloroflexota bacterium]|nr:hypothetical protein [Chloroflexota bacterium]